MPTTHGTHWLEREDLGATTVVRLKTPKALDEDIIRTVFDLMCKLIDVGRTQLVLNLAAAEFLPSMGLGKLVMRQAADVVHLEQHGLGHLALHTKTELIGIRILGGWVDRADPSLRGGRSRAAVEGRQISEVQVGVGEEGSNVELAEDQVALSTVVEQASAAAAR